MANTYYIEVHDFPVTIGVIVAQDNPIQRVERGNSNLSPIETWDTLGIKAAYLLSS